MIKHQTNLYHQINYLYFMLFSTVNLSGDCCLKANCSLNQNIRLQFAFKEQSPINYLLNYVLKYLNMIFVLRLCGLINWVVGDFSAISKYLRLRSHPQPSLIFK